MKWINLKYRLPPVGVEVFVKQNSIKYNGVELNSFRAMGQFDGDRMLWLLCGNGWDWEVISKEEIDSYAIFWLNEAE